jgi:hypothetical protein
MADNRSAFSRARETAQKETGTNGQSYYSADAKERICIDHTPLYLHAAERSKGQYGDRWELALSEDDPTNDRAILTLPANDFRDSLFNGLKPELMRGAVGPLKLTKVTYKSGSGWDLVEWTEEDKVPF